MTLNYGINQEPPFISVSYLQLPALGGSHFCKYLLFMELYSTQIPVVTRKTSAYKDLYLNSYSYLMFNVITCVVFTYLFI